VVRETPRDIWTPPRDTPLIMTDNADDRAPQKEKEPKEKEPNKRQAAAEELAAKIKRRVTSAKAAIEGGDTSVPMLMGICQALNDVVPMLVKELQIDHSTAKLARELSVCSHVLLTASREAAVKFQKKELKKGRTTEEVHADTLMKQLCTHYEALDGTITSTVEFPAVTTKKGKKRPSTVGGGQTKEYLEKKIRLQMEDIGFGLGGGTKDYSEINYDDYTTLVGNSYIEDPKNLIEDLTSLKHAINEATDELPKTLSALKQAKRAFDASYEAEHGEIPDDSEDTHKEYEKKKKAAVKAQTTKHTGWKKALDDAKQSYAEKEDKIKQKVATLKGLVEQWKAAPESESPPEKKQKKDSDSDSDKD